MLPEGTGAQDPAGRERGGTRLRASADADRGLIQQSARERKKIEGLFGDAKHNMAMVRLRLRGLSGAKVEFLLAATVQNLKRLIKIDAIPPPQPITA